MYKEKEAGYNTYMSKLIEQQMRVILKGDKERLLIMREFDSFFIKWDESKPERFGLHASSALAPFKGVGQLCYREQVFSKYYQPKKIIPSVVALRKFLEGWYVHLKWQRLFRIAKVDEEIEVTHYEPKYELYYTPDGIIRLLGKKWVVEIKSMNLNSFEEVRRKDSPPENAVNQAQLYMHLTGIPQAIILCECKDDQFFLVWKITYDPAYIQPYLDRLDTVVKLYRVHEEQNRLPKRLSYCETNPSAPRARSCPYHAVCFSPQREIFKLDVINQGREQINSSFIHEVEV